MNKNLETRSAPGLALRPALLAAALLLALTAMIALAATASAQTPGDGNTGGTSSPSGDADTGSGDDGDDDPSPPAANADDNQPDCSNSLSLEALQALYFAREYGSTTDGSDARLALIPQAERLTAAERECALFLQNQYHTELRWHFQTRCPVNTIYTHRVTGRTLTVSGVLFEEVERTEDYECTSRWLPIMTSGRDAPAGLIPPTEPVSIITVRYRVTRWRQAIVPGVLLNDSVTPPPGESHLAD